FGSANGTWDTSSTRGPFPLLPTGSRVSPGRGSWRCRTPAAGQPDYASSTNKLIVGRAQSPYSGRPARIAERHQENTNRAPTTNPTRRTRRPRAAGADLVAQLADQVDRLIKENRELKRALTRLEAARSGGAGSLGQAAKTLSGLQRRLTRALEGGGGGRRGRATAAAAAASTRIRRKVTDP